MKKNNNELKFSSLKIKKIIQENKEIGKIANMAFFIIYIILLIYIYLFLAKSLEYFLKDLLYECSNLAKQNGTKKVTASDL